MIEKIKINTNGQGLYEITNLVSSKLDNSGILNGICIVYIKHTSASLIIQENADPSAKKDLENWLNRLVPEKDTLFTHTSEGPDDMPSHIKAILTQVSISIPIVHGELTLGTWQGIYLWEHRKAPHDRSVLLKFLEG